MTLVVTYESQNIHLDFDKLSNYYKERASPDNVKDDLVIMTKLVLSS